MQGESRIVWSAVLMLGLTGSVLGTPPAAAVSGVCALITREEAAQALGAPVPAGTVRAMDVPMLGAVIKWDACFYGTEVMVARYELGSGASDLFGKYRQSLAAQPAMSGYQNVAGLGDEAFAAKGQLAVRKGQTGLIIDVAQARVGGAKELNAEKSVAVLALARL